MRRELGFTLLELLVATAIFALLSAAAYAGLVSIMDSRNALDARMERLAQMQRCFYFMGSDFRQIIDRRIRDGYGDELSFLSSNPLAMDLTGMNIEFTRAGYGNPLDAPRSTLQRVAYQIEDGNLYRVTWPALDRSQDTEAIRGRLCGQIDTIEFGFLDHEGKWHAQWPPLEAATTQKLPNAIEAILTLEDWGEVNRIFALAGGQQ
jgi:general secretion pathway protein J